MLEGYFLECLEALIACIGIGRIIRQLGQNNIKVDTKKNFQLEDHDFLAQDNKYMHPDVVSSIDPTVEFNTFLKRCVGIQNLDLRHVIKKNLSGYIWNLHVDA